jgi:hypothetical protein
VNEDYPAAALRHLQDAEALAQAERFDNAGHLIGLAAECAAKAAWRHHFPRDDIKFIHFPILRNLIRKKFKGLRDTALREFVLKHSDPLPGWEVDLRYAPDATVTRETFNLWRQRTQRLMHAAGLKRESR